MPVSLVKVLFVSFWMSTICGLPTISTLMDFAPPLLLPPPPPPPAPAQPDNASPAAVGIASTIAIRFVDLIFTATSGGYDEPLLALSCAVVGGATPGPRAARAPSTCAPRRG